ncbi:hypothetical protein DVH24_017875 [Malus domestica]|uniref:Disease resistance protein Roq1-like winged-helix domain-containing protein n=1 Tax=Malus domestica TaxID=3750 RepID=A0A498KKG7_MALDO|nr:hypothetical protein DVH24_017875 [Malus domestica]
MTEAIGIYRGQRSILMILDNNSGIIRPSSQLEKLEGTPDGKIIKLLRISFERLDDTQKTIFLDISCFFIGKDKDYVAKVLDECGFSATAETSVLRERCLSNHFENSPGHPEKWSKLWNPREVTHVLRNKFSMNSFAQSENSFLSDSPKLSTEVIYKIGELFLLKIKKLINDGFAQ